MNEDMQSAVETMMNVMRADYRKWVDRAKQREGANVEHLESMYQDYRDSMHYRVGKKYIKVFASRSIVAFIVNTDDDAKFEYGDLLKPAGVQAPARNFARGNVFSAVSYQNTVRWTGVG